MVKPIATTVVAWFILAPYVVLAVSLSTTTTNSIDVLSQYYEGHSALSPVVDIFWTIVADGSDNSASIKLCMRGHTSGWLAVGLSKTGYMVGSDAWVGWVGSDGTPIVEDWNLQSRSVLCPGICNDENIPDGLGSNDVYNVQGTQEETNSGWITELHFERKLRTGDDHDVDVALGQQYVIWALGRHGSDAVLYHGGEATDRGKAVVEFIPIPTIDASEAGVASEFNSEKFLAKQSTVGLSGSFARLVAAGDALAIEYVSYLPAPTYAESQSLRIHAVIATFGWFFLIPTFCFICFFTKSYVVQSAQELVSTISKVRAITVAVILCVLVATLIPAVLADTHSFSTLSAHAAIAWATTADILVSIIVHLLLLFVSPKQAFLQCFKALTTVAFPFLSLACIWSGFNVFPANDTSYTLFYFATGFLVFFFIFEQILAVTIVVKTALMSDQISVQISSAHAKYASISSEVKGSRNSTNRDNWCDSKAYLSASDAAKETLAYREQCAKEKKASMRRRWLVPAAIIHTLVLLVIVSWQCHELYNSAARGVANDGSEYQDVSSESTLGIVAPLSSLVGGESGFGIPGSADTLRTYYIQTELVQWDYVPSGSHLRGLQSHNLTSSEQFYTEHSTSPPRIGQIYDKLLYIEYTDNTYTTKVVNPEHLGIVSVLMRAQVGDTLQIFVKNISPVPISLHPHGVFYDKASEGFHYNDGTVGDSVRAGDEIHTGETYEYMWPCPVRSGPAENEGDSAFWMFHSHVDETADTNAGLLAGVVVYREGSVDSDRLPINIDREFVLYMNVIDEQSSILLSHNLATYLPGITVNDADIEDFEASNKMSSINGYMFGNLQGLEMVQGETVAWYLASLGTEVDLHSPIWGANSAELVKHRTDSLTILPATTDTVTMTMRFAGTFDLYCGVDAHRMAGMTASYTVTPNPAWDGNVYQDPEQLNDLADWSSGSVREYYIAAVDAIWDYTPYNYNVFSNRSFNADEMVFTDGSASDRIGSQYYKTLYYRYTDSTYTQQYPTDPAYEHMGFLGPLIRGQPGDLIRIYFKNMASRNYNMVPSASLLTNVNASSDHSPVAPGDTATYNWVVTVDAAPLDSELLSSTIHMYTSCIGDESHETCATDRSTGLIGPVVVTRSVDADLDAKPINIARELILLLTVSDENLSHRLTENVDAFMNVTGSFDLEDDDFQESNLMHGINGRLYGNLAPINVNAGERVRWYVMAVGSEVDLHGLAFHGGVFTSQKVGSFGTFGLVPGVFMAADMIPSNIGTFKVACEVADHNVAGMQLLYTVGSPTSGSDAAITLSQLDDEIKQSQVTGTNRVHYIAIDEVIWDYAPMGYDPITNTSFTDNQKIFLENNSSAHRIGSRYKKALYREYADADFTTLASVPSEWKHKGIIGPVLQAFVGDRLTVHIKNNAKFDFNFVAHGDLMDDYEAAELPIAPNQTRTVIMTVGPSSGPASDVVGESGSKIWLYHSTVAPSDIYAGLFGCVIVYPYRTDDALPSTSETSTPNVPSFLPYSVDREFVMLLAVLNENASPYLDDNIALFIEPVDQATLDIEDADFEESNLMHGVSGFLWGNGIAESDISGPYEMHLFETVRWYMLGLGSEVDIHTAHWHAQTLNYVGKRLDVYPLLPGSEGAMDMYADNQGTWLFHCHVNDHLDAGMSTVFSVLDENVTPTSIENIRASYAATAAAALELTDGSSLDTISLMGGQVALGWLVEPEGQSDTIRLSLRVNDHRGWIAFGIGSAMSDADVIMCRETPSGGSTIDDMYTTSYGAPTTDPRSDITVVSHIRSSYIECVFDRPLTPHGVSDGTDKAISITDGVMTDFIYAYGDSTSSYHGASQRGSASVAFSMTPFEAAASGGLSSDDPKAYRSLKIYLVHGLAMAFAWLVLAPAAVFAKRFLSVIKQRNMLTHIVLMIVVALMTLVSAVGIYSVSPGERFETTHGIMGTVIFALVFNEAFLGHFSRTVADSIDLKSVSTVKMVISRVLPVMHRWTGRGLVVLSFINVDSGMALYWPDWYPSVRLVPIWVCLIALAFSWFDRENQRWLSHILDKLQINTTDQEHVELMGDRRGLPYIKDWRRRLKSATSDRFYVRYRDFLCDITAFHNSGAHPGGDYLLNTLAGEDITGYLEGWLELARTGDIYEHSEYACALIQSMAIGRIKERRTVSRVSMSGRSTAPMENSTSRSHSVSVGVSQQTILAKVSLSENVYQITISRPTESCDLSKTKFSWSANVDITGNDLAAKEAIRTRSYTVVHSNLSCPEPVCLSSFNLIVKRMNDGGVSDYICDQPVGASVTVSNVRPDFGFDPQDLSGRLAILCQGTGVNPFIDFIDFLTSSQVKDQPALHDLAEPVSRAKEDGNTTEKTPDPKVAHDRSESIDKLTTAVESANPDLVIDIPVLDDKVEPPSSTSEEKSRFSSSLPGNNSVACNSAPVETFSVEPLLPYFATQCSSLSTKRSPRALQTAHHISQGVLQRVEKVTLLVSFRTADDVYLYEWLKERQAQFPELLDVHIYVQKPHQTTVSSNGAVVFVPTSSDEPDRKYRTGRFTATELANVLPSIGTDAVYICGSNSFSDEVYKECEKLFGRGIRRAPALSVSDARSGHPMYSPPSSPLSALRGPPIIVLGQSSKIRLAR